MKKSAFPVILLALALLLASCRQAEPIDAQTVPEPTASEPAVSDEIRPEPTSAEDYLSSVDYLTFELTGSAEPYFVGRWFRKEIDGVLHDVTLTSGSLLFFLTHGASSFTVEFTTITTGEIPFYAVSIDGGEPTRYRITEQTVTLPDNGFHTVRLIADGLNENVGKWQSEKGFALKSVGVSEGEIRGIRPKNKLIFFYCDSITEGVAALKGNYSGAYNSAANAYPWFCAETLHAVPYYIGYGATGIVKTGSFHDMKSAITHLSSNRPADLSVIPDLIVVNHGTNDGDVPDGDFRKKLEETLKRLQETYPGVPIAYALPFWQTKADVIRDVVSTLENGYLIETYTWFIATTDSLHPSVKGAKRAGEKLAKELISVFGSDFFETE